MTHSLHRQGSVESLKNDFVVLAYTSRDINREGAAPKLARIAEIVFDEGPINAGCSRLNASMANGKWNKEIAMASQDGGHNFIACFTDRERVKRVLEKLKEAELGISIIVSGLTEDVVALAHEVGLTPHTVNLSLGIRGNLALLPKREVQEFTTMCGHGVVTAGLVRKMAAEVKAGTKTLQEAARVAGEPCVCGIVNLARAAELLGRWTQ